MLLCSGCTARETPPNVPALEPANAATSHLWLRACLNPREPQPPPAWLSLRASRACCSRWWLWQAARQREPGASGVVHALIPASRPPVKAAITRELRWSLRRRAAPGVGGAHLRGAGRRPALSSSPAVVVARVPTLTASCHLLHPSRVTLHVDKSADVAAVNASAAGRQLLQAGCSASSFVTVSGFTSPAGCASVAPTGMSFVCVLTPLSRLARPFFQRERRVRPFHSFWLGTMGGVDRPLPELPYRPQLRYLQRQLPERVLRPQQPGTAPKPAVLPCPHQRHHRQRPRRQRRQLPVLGHCHRRRELRPTRSTQGHPKPVRAH